MQISATREEPLTIVMSASTVPSHGADRVPRFVLDQALEFESQGAEVHLLAPHASASRVGIWPKQETAKVKQWRFRYAPRRWETLTDHGIMPALRERPWMQLIVPALIVCQFFALWRLVRRVKPDVIYAHWFTPQALTACLVSGITRIPFGFTTHASDVSVWQRFGVLGRWIVRSVTRRAAFITAVSTQTADKLTVFFKGRDRASLISKLKIIPMGVGLSTEAGMGNLHHAVIIARLVEKKGIDVLLNAWPQVVAAVPDAQLTIAGTGPLETHLRSMAAKYGSTVRMPGYVMGQTKAALLASSGVVVQPSIVASDGDTDGLPVALLEGIAAGNIPVASDASGAQDLIEEGEHGYLVPAGDVTALAQALIAAMTLTEAGRRAAVERNLQMISSLAWPEIARKHLSVILDAVRMHRNRDIRASRKRLIKTAFSSAIVIALGAALWKLDWGALGGIRLAPAPLLLATTIGLAYRFYGVVIWRIVLVHLGAHSLPRFTILADIYAKAWLARYIPGTLPWIASKVYLAAEHGVAKSRLAVSSLIEAGAQIVGVGIVSLTLLALDGRLDAATPYFRGLAVLGAALLAIAMAPPIFNRAIAWGARLLRRNTNVVVSWRSISVPVALYAGGSLVSGAAFVALTYALFSTVQLSDSLFLIGAFGLSGIIGMLTPLAPSGLGTRDGAQLLLLLLIMPTPDAILLVIASRLWSVIVDILFWAISTAGARLPREQRAST